MNLGDGPPGSLRRFAAGVVGVKDDLPEAERTSLLLRKLRDDDFLPDPVSHEAILSLAGKGVGTGSLLAEESTGAEERRLHAEVEQFAARFFEIPVVERVERWRALAQASARHGRIITRLRHLKTGLGIDREAAKDPSPSTQRLLDDLMVLFPLKPENRAAEARSRLQKFESDPAFPEEDRLQAIKLIWKHRPEFAALSGDYLEQLTKPGKPPLRRPVKVKPPPKLKVEAERRPMPFVLIAVIILSAVGRLVSTTSKSPSTPSRYNPPPITGRPNSSAIPPVSLDSIPVDSQRIQQLLGAQDRARDSLKKKIREELARTDQSLDDAQLKRAVEGLPIWELPDVTPRTTPRNRLQAWTEPARERFIVQLKDGLKKAGLKLEEEPLDELVRECVPPTAVPTNPPPPGQP